MEKLRPKEITIESSSKFFGLESGSSTGSSVSLGFEIPEGMSSSDLRKAILEEKERLDLLTLTMELARGALDNSSFENRKARVKAYYDRLLNRKKDEVGK